MRDAAKKLRRVRRIRAVDGLHFIAEFFKPLTAGCVLFFAVLATGMVTHVSAAPAADVLAEMADAPPLMVQAMRCCRLAGRRS